MSPSAVVIVVIVVILLLTGGIVQFLNILLWVGLVLLLIAVMARLLPMISGQT